jgi:hypothetical protein
MSLAAIDATAPGNCKTTFVRDSHVFKIVTSPLHWGKGFKSEMLSLMMSIMYLWFTLVVCHLIGESTKSHYNLMVMMVMSPGSLDLSSQPLVRTTLKSECFQQADVSFSCLPPWHPEKQHSK